MLAVSASDNGFFADLDSVSYQGALYNGAGFHLGARHQDAVNDTCAFPDFHAGKEDGIEDLSFDDAALCDKCALNAGIGAYIVGQ